VSAAIATAERWVALVGNPNTGKSTLFNALTGGRARVGNYPGVTVERKVGTLRDEASGVVRVLDLPGTYSLAARSPDEMVAVDVLLGRREDTPRPDAVVVVVDASNLERNLYLVSQVLEVGRPVVVALNMVDTARDRGIEVDAAALASALGVPVVPCVAHRRRGIDELVAAMRKALGAPPPAPLGTWPAAMAEAEAALARDLDALGLADRTALERRRALLDVGGEAERRVLARAPAAADALAAARRRLEAAGTPATGLETSVRYDAIGDVVARAVTRPERPPVTTSDRIDAVLTHRLFGTLILFAVMTLVFVSIFQWSGPLMDWIGDDLFGRLGEWVSERMPEGMLHSLVVDGVIAGVGGVLVFLPQILILFLFLGLLEGCGYMARAAFLMDRLLRWCGLSGRSFVPMLSSFACAIPGILAARTIESRRDRIATILVAPLMSCSARIPVYAILTAAFVPATTVFGFVSLQGLVFAGMYLVGILVAVPVAFLLKRTLLKGGTPSFLVELPPYRWPRLSVVLRRTFDQGRAFVVRAGTLILAASVVIWALSYFPRHPDPGASARAAHEAAVADAARVDAVGAEAAEAERARQEQAVLAAEAQSEALGRVARAKYEEFLAARAKAKAERDVALEAMAAEVDDAAAAESLRHSFLGRAGRAIEPAFAPIGWDWKVGMAVIASFPAREVVVSTLGVIYELGSDEDEESVALRDRLREARWEDGPRKGRPVFDLASALALMVFFALCAQCASTLVMIWKETATWRWAAFAFVYMTALAYVGALVTSGILRAVLSPEALRGGA
jgi:ferrous iron transport protein B